MGANLNSVPDNTDSGHQDGAGKGERDGGRFEADELERHDGGEADTDLFHPRIHLRWSFA